MYKYHSGKFPLSLTSLFLAAFSLLAVGGAIAEPKSSSELVQSLPAQIPEILTGGNWQKGDIGGVYRAVVVMSDKQEAKTAGKPLNEAAPVEATGMPGQTAEVFIQWISYENGVERPKVVKTVSIKEFNRKQLRHAFLAMDTLRDNEMTLLVTSYDDRKDADVSVSVKATSPGQYLPSKNRK